MDIGGNTMATPIENDRSGRLCLVGIVDGVAITHELPSDGELVVGRAPDVDLRVDHPSISRKHARLHLGSSIEVEDLGSANGTRVREQPLTAGQRVEVRPGEAMRVGAVTLVLQYRIATPNIRPFWTHGYFEARVAEECARAEATGGEFAVMRIHLDHSAAGLAEEGLGSVLGTADVAGIYAPGEYEALLIPARDRDFDGVADHVVEWFEAAGVHVTAGVAHYPRDGRNAYVLLATASAVARGEASPELGPVDDARPSEAMRQVYELCAQVAKGEINVLVLGETGVGKEVMAERIHRESPRANGPLVKLNCAALSESLLEAELFGYERGAFTGADRAKQGLLETAQNGTVFLDEIGELPLGLQAKLLRVIDEHKVLRIGGLKPTPIDVRFVAATNRDLEVEVGAGRFRQDLYYRLNGVSLHIPPLRERRSEIPGLVRHFTAGASRGRTPPQLDRAARELLETYAWPGNIRELRNLVERALLLCGDGPITPAHLPVEKMRATVASRPSRQQRVPSAVAAMSDVTDEHTPAPEPAARESLSALEPRGPLRGEMNALERARIEEALAACGGNQTRAAQMLGMPRPTFLKRLDAYGIVRPRKK